MTDPDTTGMSPRSGVLTIELRSARERGELAIAPVRILIVTPRIPPDLGGVERHVHEVSRRLATMGCDVTVLCTDRSGSLPRSGDLDGVEVRRVRAWPRARDYYFAPGVWREMGNGTWDVIHVQSFHTLVAPLAMLRARQLHVPFVLTFHGGGHSSRLRRSLRRLQQIALGPLVRRAARLVAIARFEVPLYGDGFRVPPGRFEFIPNGSNATDRTAVLAAETSDAPVIASIGRLERYKGHHRVIAAFPEVLRRCPEASLWIVGTGPEEAALRRQAQSLGLQHRIDFRSTPSDEPEKMMALLAVTSLVVCMSEFESHPLVAVEAAAAGRPLLVAATSGLHELAEDGWARAIPSDSSSTRIADAILESLDEPLVAPAMSLPTWDDCTASLLALYREVVSCAS